MEIIRQIGRHDILVETDEPCGLYFEESAVAQGAGENAVVLDRAEILSLLARGDDYLPLSLHWELLDKCNFTCPFCYIVGHSSEKMVRFTEIKNHLTELIQSGLLFCTLTGGEVTIHPDFIEIYGFLKQNGVVVEVFTNGFAIDDSLIELFRAYPPSSIEVSVYSLENNRLHQIYGARDRLAASRVLENVLRLKRAGLRVSCKTFLNSITITDFDAVVHWCLENNIEHYSSSEVTQGYDGTNLTGFAIKTSDTQSLPLPSPKTAVCLPCKTKNYGSAINAAFSIVPCPAIKLNDCTFDLRKLGVAESLKRMKAFMRRFQDTEIQGKCVSEPTGKCGTCIAYANPVRNEVGEILHFSHT